MSSAFAADWKTGEYGGTGTGFQGGEISVKVTVNSDGAIESIEQTEADAKSFIVNSRTYTSARKRFRSLTR
mgnify:CR=1 FL=1